MPASGHATGSCGPFIEGLKRLTSTTIGSLADASCSDKANPRVLRGGYIAPQIMDGTKVDNRRATSGG